MTECHKRMMGKLTLKSLKNIPVWVVRTHFPVRKPSRSHHFWMGAMLIISLNGRSMAKSFPCPARASWRSSVTCWEMPIRLVAEYCWLTSRIIDKGFNRSSPCFLMINKSSGIYLMIFFLFSLNHCC